MVKVEIFAVLSVLIRSHAIRAGERPSIAAPATKLICLLNAKDPSWHNHRWRSQQDCILIDCLHAEYPPVTPQFSTQLITLPAPQPMVYPYYFISMAEMAWMEGNEYV